MVLTGITRKEFDTSDLGMVLPEHLVICRDEINESTDPEAFQKRLWDMFPRQFPEPLSLPQIDRVRWHLFPEIRINPPEQLLIGGDQGDNQKQDAQGDLHSTAENRPSIHVDAEPNHPSELFPDIIKVMDLEQEALARSLGDGHRVIHGVAGSGKTLILGYRCVHLANTFIKPVLVLCFNVTLAAKLREVIQINELSERVQVRHFHDWCGDQLRTYHVDKPAAGSHYVRELVQTVIDATDSGRIPRAQYGAVMIDEGHDFEPDWLRLVVSMIDPDTNSLLLLYDDAQSIYTKRSLGFSLSSVGVQAVGRTKILRINYRNTDEILNYAYQFASKWLSGEELDDDQITTVTPETAGRHGPNPVFKLCPGFDEEVQLIIKCIREQHDKGMPWSDICVTYRANWMGEKLNEAMKSAGLPVHWLRSKTDKTRLSSSDSSIKLMTMHSSKGLEYPLVIVSGVGSMPDKHAEAATEAKLLYVAMTRATEKLLVTAHQRSEFAEKLAA